MKHVDSMKKGKKKNQQPAAGGQKETSGNSKENSPAIVEKKTILKACTCLSTRHPFVTSCTGCGYILCQADVEPEKLERSKAADSMGSVFFDCPNCHTICLPPLNTDAAKMFFPNEPKTIAAYTHKDKLLQFDREHAQRTKVYDAQGDYYKTTMDTHWLSEEERKQIERLEKRRLQEQLRSKNRQKRVTIHFDVTGTKKLVQVVDGQAEDEESETVQEAEERYLRELLQEEEVSARGGVVIGGEGGGGYIRSSSSVAAASAFICSPWADEVDDRPTTKSAGSVGKLAGAEEEEEEYVQIGGAKKTKKAPSQSQLIENFELYKSNTIAGDIYRFLHRDSLKT